MDWLNLITVLVHNILVTIIVVGSTQVANLISK
jgi:hypothetical protein